jgi:hypothetical protein
MARGGARPGAGRRKGTVSEPTKHRIAIAEAALVSGLTPLEYMLSILRDETKPQHERFTAAKEAAPYLHPKLAAVQHSGDKNNPVALEVISGVPREMTDDDDDHAVNGAGSAH